MAAGSVCAGKQENNKRDCAVFRKRLKAKCGRENLRKWIIVMFVMFISLIGARAFAQENMVPSSSNYLYADGWLYCAIYADDEYQLVRSQSDGSSAQRVSKGHGLYNFFSVVGDIVFYLGTEKELGGFDTRTQLRAVNVDGQNDRALSDLEEFDSMFATNTHVYAETDDQQLIRYRIDPWDEVNRIELPSDARHFQIADGWLYYEDDGLDYANDEIEDDGPDYADDSLAGIRRIKTEGGGESITFLSLEEESELSAWAIMDGDLYYCLIDEANATSRIWRMPLDGGDRQLVSSGAWQVEKFADGWAYARHISPGGSGFDSPWSLDYGDAVHINLQTGALQELGDRSPSNMFSAGDHIIYDSFEEGQPPLLLDADGNVVQPLPELELSE